MNNGDIADCWPIASRENKAGKIENRRVKLLNICLQNPVKASGNNKKLIFINLKHFLQSLKALL